MNDWKPISIAKLQRIINEDVNLMSLGELRDWEKISIKPSKWIEPTFGSDGEGFWVVGKFRNHIIWYNDIENGFNISTFKHYGKIDYYAAEQDDLRWTIRKLFDLKNKQA